jgi:glycosyltransferase involved in cell wall biosynthesis
MSVRDKIYIDLTEYSPKYRGGVSTFARGIAMGFANSIKRSDFKVTFIVEKMDESVWLANNLDSKISVVILNRKLRKKITNLFHRLNYNTFQSYWLFSLIKSLEFSRKTKKSLRNGILYCPTTYLNVKLSNLACVVSVHDCQEKRFPENFSKKQLLYREFQLKYTLTNSSLIQVSSKFISDEFQLYFQGMFKDFGSPLLIEIPEGVDTTFFRPDRHISVSRKKEICEILVPSSFHIHKNHLELFNSLKYLDGKRKIRTYLTGEGVMMQECREIASTFKSIDCQFIGYVSNEELRDLYRKVDLVVICSKYESSSLPILESLSCNTKVLASNINPHVEARDKLGLPIQLYQLGDQHELAKLIEKLLNCSKTQEIYKKVLPLDWENIAEKYLKIFGEIIEKRRELI